MSKVDVKHQALAQVDKIEQARHPAEIRPSDHLMGHHLNGSLRTSHLGPEPRSKVQKGSVDLYNRLKVRDPIDSLYAGAIVALSNALMSAYGDATYGSQSSRDENLRRAYEGTALFIDLVTAFESRRDLKDGSDPERRAKMLQDLMMRFDLAANSRAEQTE